MYKYHIKKIYYSNRYSWVLYSNNKAYWYHATYIEAKNMMLLLIDIDKTHTLGQILDNFINSNF